MKSSANQVTLTGRRGTWRSSGTHFDREPVHSSGVIKMVNGGRFSKECTCGFPAQKQHSPMVTLHCTEGKSNQKSILRPPEISRVELLVRLQHFLAPVHEDDIPQFIAQRGRQHQLWRSRTAWK